MSYSGIVSRIHVDSIAEEIGLAIGDKILEINGQALTDIIDLSFAFAEEEIELLVEKKNGEQELIGFDKEYDEELGVEFESAVFDGIQRCGNKCWFCFVDQVAPGMRSSLSVKDDDYRMSFLYGNFVTLTNLRQKDLDRIKRLHLSPLFVSVHATDGDLRARMLQNKRAANIMEQLELLRQAEIKIHTQIVLCPGINDGKVLEKTLRDLIALRPMTLSLAIVPVGLTRYRKDCYPLRKFTAAEAADIIDMVEPWQHLNREKTGEAFVYLGDEFYFLAGRELPAYEDYDGFPQLENGIGLTRNFIAEWESVEDIVCHVPKERIYLDIVCGKSAEKVIKFLIERIEIPNVSVRVVAVENVFFGEDITVTGLLTGQDIVKALKPLDGARTGVIIPGVALRAGEEIFLDDYRLGDLQKELDARIVTAHSGSDLKKLLLSWNDNSLVEDGARQQTYTWQSNCAYSK